MKLKDKINSIKLICPKKIELYERVEYQLNGELHRKHGPAYIKSNGDQIWYKNNKMHRENGPAIEWSNGTKEWLQNGLLHRIDGPAIEWSNGDRSWYQNGHFIKSENCL